MRTFLPYTKGYRRWILLGVACSVAEAVLELELPQAMSQIVDVGIAGGDRTYIMWTGLKMLVLPLVDVQGQGVGVVGLDRVVPLAGDHRRPCLSLVGIVGDEGLRGPFLRGLDEMGVGGSGDQPVAEHHVIDLHRG